MSNDFSFTTSCDLDVKGFEESFLKSKKHKMRIAINDSEEYIRELCREENSELVLNGNRYKVLGFPTYFKEGNEQGIYVIVEQIISDNNE